MDGNAQNMFHGNHQGDAYFRYDATAPPRPMGPPGAYARHRAPHPLQQQQQQSQYPAYQPPADNMYTMAAAEQHGAAMGMGDLGAWSQQTPSPYGAPAMGYGHPQAPQQQQRQPPQPQPSYRHQHMTGYPQQDPQKMQFTAQQNLMSGMMPGQVYGQTQPGQPQRGVPQHYGQSPIAGHGMYPGAPQPQPTVSQPYGAGPYGAGLQQQQLQPGRSPHMGYGHNPMEQQAGYGQHLQNATPVHHMASAQQQQAAPQQMPGLHPGQPQPQQTSNHLPGHLPGQQPQQSLHQPQIVHPQPHSQPHTPHSISSLSSMHTTSASGQSQQQQQQQQQQPNQHLPSQPQQQQQHPGLGGHGQQPSLHQPQHSNAQVMPPHNAAAYSHLSAYGVPPQSQQQQQQPSQPPQQQQQSQAQQQPSGPSPYLQSSKQQQQLNSGSPQYRAPFPQLSPQMSSPRPPQISPHPQMSPRPVMSPAKPQNTSSLSPHPHIPGVPSPRPGQQQGMGGGGSSAKNNSPAGPVTTLQALEQMVMPPQGGSMPIPTPMDQFPSAYRHQQLSANNPLSPMGPRMPMSPQQQQPQQQQQWPPPPTQHRTSSSQSIPPHLYPQQQQQALGHQQQQQQQLSPVVSQPQNQMTNQQHQLLSPEMGMGGQTLPSMNSSLSPFSNQQAQLAQSNMSLNPQQQQQPSLQSHSIDEITGNIGQQHHRGLQLGSQMQHQQQQQSHKTPLMSHQQSADHLLMDPFGNGCLDTLPSMEAVSAAPVPVNDSIMMSGGGGSASKDSMHDNSQSMPAAPNNDENTQESVANSAMNELGQNSQDAQQHAMLMDNNLMDTSAQDIGQPQDNSSLLGNDHDSNSKHSLENNNSCSGVSNSVNQESSSHLLTEGMDQSNSGNDCGQTVNVINSSNNNSSVEVSTEVVTSQNQPGYDSQSDNSQSSLQPMNPVSETGSTTVQQPSPITAGSELGQTEISSTDQMKSQFTDLNSTAMDTSLNQQQMPRLDQSQMMTPIPPTGQMIPMTVPPQMHGMPPQMMPPLGTSQDMYGMPGGLMHHQEKGMIQQQLQELYCMVPSPETTEKIQKLQERMNVLQQHEMNEQCNGGPQCSLQMHMYPQPMIESPQVSSTTGRGRGRGVSKPRKPRQKKADKLAALNNSESSPMDTNNLYSAQSLPVSEDCVTPGAGLTDIPSEMTGMNDSDVDASQDKILDELDTSTDDKGKKKKKKAKESKASKEGKEKKKREPKEGSKSKKKRGKKGDEAELDSTIDTSMDPTSESKLELSSEIPPEGEEEESKDVKPATDEVTDFDDIPVSKIPIKSLMEDAAAKEEANENSDGSKPPDSETPKKKSKSKSSSAKRSRPPAQRKPPSSKSKRRGRMITESDGEGDDLISTPPPSPTIEGDIDSSKRRSARNTQRKKYVDDVMLRFSDDESGITSPGGSSKKEKKEQKEHNESDSVITGDVSTTDVVETKDSDKPAEDFGGKPNYVYVNTTDEDSMVVQYVLAMRMGKRELKPDPVPEVKVEPKVEETSEVKEETPEDGVEKTNEEKTEKPAEEDSTEKAEEKPEEISDAPPKEEEPKIESSTEEKIEEEEPVEKVEEPKEPESEKSEDSEMPVDEEAKTESTPETKEETKEGDEKPVVESDIKTEPVTEEKPDEPKPEPVYVDVEEYFVKYRNFSYLHCEWRTEEELFKGDRRVAAKIKRYHQKQAQQFNIFENMEEEPFNPDFTEVDRVLDMSEHKDSVTGEKTKHFLVKWKSLPYEDCTWELEEDVDHAKIEQFERFTKIPPRSEWKPKKRPHPDQWKKLEKTPVFKGGNTLRPYQLEGLNWLKFSWYNSHNCILADEMGLGKTIQSLTFVHSIYEYGIRGPFLVIAPLSTIPNWQREFESWTDMNVIVYHGSVTSKQMLQEYEFYYKNDQGKFIKDLNKFNVLITTFEMIVTDYMDLRQLNWRACVIDEAHRLKNRNCKLLDGLRQLNLEHRLLLSGTPLQNNVSELFSLLNFLEPSQFASNDDFVKEFGSLKTESEVQKLQVLLKPMMLRRLKDDVEKSLAPKEETIVEVELTNIQKKYYRGILEQNFSFLTKGTSAANIPNLMNTMMELRKCCIHPYLLNGAEEQIQYDFKLQHGEDPDSYYKNLINSSGKMVLIDKLLPKLKANGHRVLIFSQMVRCLDILEDYLVYRKYPFERIDGRIRGDLRQAAIDRYSKPDSDRFVFLLCTKAGGLGINLTSADTVIIYDSDWNPQNDLQAQARCHRIGQQKMVKIYRLLCRNTYEREMFDKASMKLGLDKAILQSMNTSQGNDTKSKQLSKKEIEDLLKKGAYGALMDEDEGKKFCEEDIDSILKRRTTVITMESEKGSTFSKASFAMSGNRADIQIDDPDFWKKWAKKADIDPAAERDEKEDLVILEPRRRTQIKRFGHDEGVMDISEESASDSDEEGGGVGSRMKRRRERREKRRRLDDRNETDYIPRERDGMGPVSIDEVSYGNWARSECFKVEKGLLSFGWGRWVEILEHGGFKRGWRDVDVEELARIILLYCLKCYRGDEKIKNFIWDLIAPNTDSEDTFRNHSGLHNLVPRGRNAKGRNGGKAQKDQQCGSAATSTASSPREKSQGKESDPNHWSNDDKYDADSILESSYRKHLARHANKVLLRVRMLFYIKHEIIGDYVQQISDGVNISDLPIRPPLTNEQMPSAWWNPNCCDKSLLVGTYKHGCENYREIRADTTLCFITHCGPPEDGPTIPNANMDEEGKLDDEDVDEDGRGTPACGKDDPKPSTSSENKDLDLDRPSSSGIDDDDVIMTSVIPPTGAGDDHTWPTMQDLNTRLRRVITSYQRNYKKEELKAAQQQKAKLQAMTQSTPLVIPSGSSSASSTPTPMGSGNTSSTPTNTGSANLQQQQQMQAMQKQTTSQQQQQNAMAGIPSAADIGLILSLGLGLNPADQSQLANIDLNKLAMYLQKFGSREKIEQQVRERERARLLQVSKKWNRREENEFLRVLTGYGIDLQSHTTIPTPDWSRFKAMARLEKKTDETMSDYYKVFIAMCKRQAGVKLLEDEKGLENIIDDINEDHARLILDRLELLSKLREVAKSSKLDDRLRLCKNNYDTPDWWESGKHDRELIRAILKHGLYRTEVLVMNDPDLSFRDSCRKYEKNLEIYNQNTILKMEAELLKLEQTQMLMKGIKAEELTIKPTVEVKPVPKEKEPEAAVEEDLTITKTAPTEEKPVEEPDVEMKEDEVKDKIETNEEEQKEKPVETEEKIEDIEKTAAPKSPSVVEKEAEEIDETAAPKAVEEESKDIKAEEPPTEEKMEIDEEEKKLPEVSSEEEKVTKEGEPEISEEPIEDESKAKVTPEEKEEEPENLEKIEKEVKEENTEAPKEEVSEEVTERAKSIEKEKPQVEVIPIEKPASPKPVEKIPDVVLPKMDLLAELKIVEEECKKQAAELKARFPDLEVIQPSMKTKPLDPFLLKELAGTKDIKFIPKLLEKQLLIRWFRDFALEKRISHIIYCVEKNDWPVGKSYSAYTGCQGMDLDVPLYETIKRIPTATVEINLAGSSAMGSMGGRSQTPDVITITTDQGLTKQLGNSILASIQGALAGSGPTSQQQLNQSLAALSGNGKGKRKRHIAIDVETERAKLHALLNNSQSNQSGSKSWNEDELKGDLRRGSGGSSLQPPPAHQPMSRSSMASYNKPTLIPGTSSTLTPIDLSSSLPKMNMASMMKNPIDLSEVQDFSMSSKSNKQSSGQSMSGSSGMGGNSPYSLAALGGGNNKGNKLDSMLSKLMKKNNVPVPVEEPVVGKEKKKRKLDEIVLGLSAAKEQKMYPDPMIPVGRKPQITPSVSVTPANVGGSGSSGTSSANQKPFTITVTSVPANSNSNKQQQQQKGGNNPSTTSGLQALQNMAGLSGASSKDLNALLAEAAKAEQQAFLKQQQKILQQLPANSPHRKTYEAMYNEMKQAADLSQLYNQKMGGFHSHDAKVNKWLQEQQTAMEQGAAELKRQTQRATRQNQQQQQLQQKQEAVFSRLSLTGEESVPVIHKITGKRLSGSKAPQLKRITQWLTENPAYEIDPKWLELAQIPPPSSPKPSPSAESTSSTSSSKPQHRSSSNSSAMANQNLGQYNASSSGSSASATKKQRAQDAALNAAMQFPGLAGLNPNLLANLPGLGANFDPKNPLSMLPFAGMAPGLAGLGNLGNLNNMNLFANLAGLGGLGNLAGMDPQSLAAMMTAAGLDANALAALTGASGSGTSGSSNQRGSSSGNSGAGSNSAASSSMKNQSSNQTSNTSKGRKEQTAATQQQSSSSSSNSKNNSGNNNSNFPFLFPNPSLLYPLGLNPYSLNPNMSPYDQLAQYSLLNGTNLGGSGSGSAGGSTQSPRQSGSGNKGNTGRQSGSGSGMSMSQSQQGSASKSGSRQSNSNSMGRQSDLSQLQSLLSPHDPHLLESLSRVAAGLDITQSNQRGSGGGSNDRKGRDSSSSSASSSMSASKDAMDKLEKERRKLMDNLARSGFPTDMATIQALAQGKLPPSLAKASTKDLQALAQLPPEFSQALLYEMAQAAGMGLPGMPGTSSSQGGSSNSASSASKRSSREAEMRELEAMSKAQMEILARNLGMSSSISLIPTSGQSMDALADKAKRRNESASLQRQSSQSQSQKHHEEAFALAMEEAKLRSIRESSTRSERTSVSMSAETSIEKVPSSNSGSSQNPAMNLSSLPSQTTITLSSTSNSGAQSTSSQSSKRSVTPTDLSVPQAAENLSKPASSLEQNLPPKEVEPQSSHHEMDIEDLIAPSKVSKGGGMVMDEMEPEMDDQECQKSKKDDDELSNLDNSGGSSGGENDKNRPAKRARGKRPRSGDDLESLGVAQPERKRELRSSAGRAAAAAAARMAAEEKAAQAAAAAAAAQEGLNLSGGEDQKSESRT